LKEAPVWPPYKKIILEERVAQIKEEEKESGRKTEAWLGEWVSPPKKYPKELRKALRERLVLEEKRKMEAAKRMEKVIAEEKEALIKIYEQSLAQHRIHGKAPEEERRKMAENLAETKLKGLKEKILKE
jgi:hypothetical protein